MRRFPPTAYRLCEPSERALTLRVSAPLIRIGPGGTGKNRVTGANEGRSGAGPGAPDARPEVLRFRIDGGRRNFVAC